MTELVFCLGREPRLSLAELSSYFEAEGLEGRLTRIAPEIAWADIQRPPELQTTIERLGGTIKIGEVLARFDDPLSPEQLAAALANLLREKSPVSSGKLAFGLSMFPARLHPDTGPKRISNLIKDKLQESGSRARYVLPLRGSRLSSAQVIENRLIAHGTELLLTAWKRGWLAARTRAVQPVTEEAQRDMGKPVRRLREGILPPKLARIMVNLARTTDTKSLLDPFCGSGVILMEALLLGLQPVGSDQAPEALEAARRNLDWLVSRAESVGRSEYQLIHSKVENLSLRIPPLSVDAIATEPYLGPPLSSRLPRSKAQDLSKELCELYLRALAEIRIVLRPGGRCVFILPIFRTDNGLCEVEVQKHLPLIGFREYNPLAIIDGTGEQANLRHSRPGQRVLRRVLVLENRPQ